MDIVIKDIPEEGIHYRFDTRKDGWFREALKEALQKLCDAKKDGGRADFDLYRTGANVDCTGQIHSDCHPTCSRCLKVFPSKLDIDFRLTLAPLYENERQIRIEEERADLVKEDLEFAYYEGDQFNLGDVIREQIILATPMQSVCKKNCKGLCPGCGKDLNKGPCRCESHREDPRWEALKHFKSKNDPKQ